MIVKKLKALGLALDLVLLLPLGVRWVLGARAMPSEQLGETRSQVAAATGAPSRINPETDLEYLGAFRLPD
jgi:hypothetical protein